MMFSVNSCNARLRRGLDAVLRIAAVAVLAGVAVGRAAAGDVSIEASAEPTEIYLGESVTLTLRVSNIEEGMEPDLGPLANASFLGQRDESHQSLVIINGRPQVSGFSGRLFQYRVVPDRTGSVRLGPLGIRSGNAEVATAPGPVVNVSPIPQQDTALLALALSKPQVIVDEPFTLTLTIRVRQLPPPYVDISPLPKQAPPMLSIPYLDRQENSGLESENIQDLLNGKLVNNGEAFHINAFSLGGLPMGGFFGQQNLARFRLDRQAVMQQDIPYYEYSFPLQYTPRREGVFTFGPVVFKGRVFTHVTSAGEGRVETVYAVAPAIDLTVTSPPLNGRPDTYIGAIGSNLTASAALDTQTCLVGDPLELTLTLGGDVRLANITAPQLAVQPALQQDFRIYADTVRRESQADSLRYRFMVRPSKAGTLEFPPIALSYYDTASSSYRTVHTEPIPVRANAVTEVQGDIVITDTERSVRLDAAGAAEDAGDLTPAPFVMAVDVTAGERFFDPGLHLPLLLAGPLVYLVFLLLRHLQRWSPAWRTRRRRRRAAAEALRHLQGDGLDSPQLADILRAYLQVQCEGHIQAATPSECRTLLLAHGLPDELASGCARLLEFCARDAFNGEAGTVVGEAGRRKAGELIQALDAAFRCQRKARRFFSRRPPIPPLSMILLLAATAFTLRAEAPVDFEAQRTQTLLLAADEPADFAALAEAMAVLIDQGSASAGLFYNYGTALLMAGEMEGAMEALLRAERYGGTDWSLRRNLLLAWRGKQADPAALMPWYRIPLAWHYRLPVRQRITLAASAFLAGWLLALLAAHRRLRDLAIVVSAFAFVTALVLGASVLSSIYSENRAAETHARRLPPATMTTEEGS